MNYIYLAFVTSSVLRLPPPLTQNEGENAPLLQPHLNFGAGRDHGLTDRLSTGRSERQTLDGAQEVHRLCLREGQQMIYQPLRALQQTTQVKVLPLLEYLCQLLQRQYAHDLVVDVPGERTVYYKI